MAGKFLRWKLLKTMFQYVLYKMFHLCFHVHDRSCFPPLHQQSSRVYTSRLGWNRIIMFLAGFYISFESCFCMKSMAVSLRTHRLRLTVVCLWRGAALDFGAGKLHRPEWMSVDIVKICENGLTRNSWVGVSGLGDYVSVLIQIFISNVYCISWFLWFYSTPCPCTTFAVCGFEKLGTRQQQKWAKPLASSQQNAVVFLSWIWWFCCIKNHQYSWLMHIQCELSRFFTLLYASLRAADVTYLCFQAPAHPLRIYRVLWAGTFMCIFAVVPVPSLIYHHLPWFACLKWKYVFHSNMNHEMSRIKLLNSWMTSFQGLLRLHTKFPGGASFRWANLSLALSPRESDKYSHSMESDLILLMEEIRLTSW